MKRIDELKKHLKPGRVYRRADLQKWSASVDRHLQELLSEGVLEKLSGGVYHVPKKSVFGKVPAEERDLVRTFLKDDHFLILSPNDYNALGLGATQLYNSRKVYNYKRHGDFQLGNRTFRFVRKPRVPHELTKEFLLIDFLNNLNTLAENRPDLLANACKRLRELESVKLRRMARDYGTVGTKKLVTSLLG